MAARRSHRAGALAAAVVLVLEAAGIVLLNWILSIFVDEQRMSMAGLTPRAMSTGAWVGGLAFGLYLLYCAFVVVRSAVRDRAPTGFPRTLLIACAVVHGVLGALAVGLAGWVAFLAMMVVLGLLVFTLLAYGAPAENPGQDRDPDPGTEGSGAPAAA